MSNNSNLHNAKRNKNDEFYTMYKDVENECEHYASYFENQVIYLNCDNPKYSQFWAYFHKNFTKFKLKMLMSTYYSFEGKSSLGVYGGVTMIQFNIMKAYH